MMLQIQNKILHQGNKFLSITQKIFSRCFHFETKQTFSQLIKNERCTKMKNKSTKEVTSQLCTNVLLFIIIRDSNFQSHSGLKQYCQNEFVMGMIICVLLDGIIYRIWYNLLFSISIMNYCSIINLKMTSQAKSSF